MPGKRNVGPNGYVAVSSNGRQLALLEPGQLTVRELASGKEVQVIPLVEQPDLDAQRTISDVGGVAFSPDGTRLAAGVGTAVWIIDAATWKVLRREPFTADR